MNFNQKQKEFIERERKQAQTKRTKLKQLREEVALHEANYKGIPGARPRFSFLSLLVAILGLIALVLISALVITTYLRAVS